MSDKIINESMRIAGKKIDFDKKIDVEYPFTGEVIGTVPAGNAEHAKNALEIAANYTPKLTRYERQKILQTAAEELVKRKCFRCNKESKMGKFERYCSPTCRYHATRNYTSGYKVGY